MIPAPIATTLIFFSVPLLLPHVDPTYFLFRSVITLSPISTLFCRLFIISITTFHGSVLIYVVIIYGTNIFLMLHTCLRSMISQTHFEDPKHQEETYPGSTISNLSVLCRVSKFSEKLDLVTSFSRNLSKYRQLQLMITIFNQFFFIILPFAIIVQIVCCVAFGYMLIKLTESMPFPITLLAMFFISLFVVFVHVIVPLIVEVTVKSENFIKFWQLCKVSAYRKKQLQSFRLMRVSIGPFGYVTRGLKIQCFSLTLYYTVSMIVSI